MNAGTTGLGALLGMLGLSSSGATGGGLTAAQLRAQLLPQFTSAGTPATGATMSQIPRNIASVIERDPNATYTMNPQTGQYGWRYSMEMGGDAGGTQTQWYYPTQTGGQSAQPGTVDEAGLNAAIQAALAKQGGSSSTALPSGLAALGQMLTTPFSFDATKLDQTPGYQFTLQQGTKALQNSAAAQGLGLSGAQEKGLLSYATGLADQTYGNQYNRALQQYQTNYGIANDMVNRLSGLASLGQNAAAGVGNAGMQTASNIGNLITGAGNAQAAGTVGSANALSSGLSGLGGSSLLYSLLNNSNASGGLNPGNTTLYGSDPLGTYGAPTWSSSYNI